MKTLLKRILPTSKSLRAVSVLAGGNAAGQLAIILVSPILTRLYTPENFGVLAIYMSVTGILSVIGCLRYEFAIPLPSAHTRAIDVSRLSLICAIAVSFVTLITILLFRKNIAYSLDMPALEKTLFFVPLGVLLLSIFKILNMWCVRTEQYILITTARLYQVAASILVQLTLSKFGSLGLVFGQLANQGAGISRLYQRFKTDTIEHKWNLKDIGTEALTYKRLPLFSTWASLANKTSTQLPAITFAFAFDAVVVGFYALAMRIIATPGAMVGSSIQKVYLSHAAEHLRQNRLHSVFENAFTLLLTVMVPVTLLIALILPTLFQIMFGEEWKTAGEFGRWLMAVACCQVCISPLMTTYTILGKQKQELKQQVIQFTLRLTSLLLGFYLGNPLIAVILYSCASTAGYLIFLSWAYKTLKIPRLSLLILMTKACLIALAINAPVIAAITLNKETDLLAPAIILSALTIVLHSAKCLSPHFRSSK